MGYSNYIPLRVHTEYGIGSSNAEEYLTRLLELDIDTIGIVDSNFIGVYEFYNTLKDNGINLLIGAELEKPLRCIVFFENEEGYKNYSRLLSGMNYRKDGLIFIVFDIKSYEDLKNENIPVYFGIEHPLNYFPEDVKTVAVPKVLYARKEDIYIYSIIDSIRNKKIFKISNHNLYLKTNEEMKRFPKDALKNTFEIAERINFSPFEKPIIFHSEEKDHKELYDFIKTKKLNPIELKRAEFEFKIIKEKNLSRYFILVKKLTDFLNKENIMANVRGSAAGSFILYLFGLLKVNPLKFNISFERFLNPERDDLPDIDIDVDYKRRDSVFEFLKKLIGKEYCGFVSVINRFDTLSSLSSVSKVIGIPPSLIGKEILPEIKELSLRIIGKPSYISRHPSAIALANEMIFESIPVAIEDGFYTLRGDKDAIEKIGLIKLDILGVRGFSTILELKTEIDDIYDENVFTEISNGKTLGAFQIESPTARNMLMKMKPKSIEEISIALALIRPGAKQDGYREHYLKRRLGEEEIKYPESLEEILKETLGVFIYQEQAIEALKVFAGFSGGEAERYRKILTKENKKEIEKLKSIFFERAKKIGRKEIEFVWERLKNFTKYGFNKAHSINYAYLAYLSMYYKVHNPLEFFKGVLNSGGGYYPCFAYIEEARRCNVDVLLPDINVSDWKFKIVDGKLITGLGFIKFISEKLYKKIISKRPFKDIYDFIKKTEPEKRECEYLIKSGALDNFNISREEMFSILYTGERIKGMMKNDYFSQELEALSFSRYHPAMNFERSLKIKDINEGIVKIVGRVIGMRFFHTENDKKICFLTIDDETGVAEIVLFSNNFYELSISIGDIIFINGIYDKNNFSIKAEFKNIEKIKTQ